MLPKGRDGPPIFIPNTVKNQKKISLYFHKNARTTHSAALAQIRMENFYKKISSFNFLLTLSIISLLIILVIDFYLNDIPELFIGV